MARTKDIGWLKTAVKFLFNFYLNFLRKLRLNINQFPGNMESLCPYKETDWNFNLDFLENYIWNHAETFTVVSSHENHQTDTQKSIG